MNYRHLYHAGNFADVFKHCILIAILEKLMAKSSALTILDTHAGIGLYDLQSTATQKTQEYQAGVAKLFTQPTLIQSPILARYLTIIKNNNVGRSTESGYRYYPGSPLIASDYVRSNDQLILCELHPDDYLQLKFTMAYAPLAQVHHQNGYFGMKAFLPPKTPRGLVLIDPPFETMTEFDDIMAALTKALKHFRQGIYMIWYPYKDPVVIAAAQQQFSALNFPCLHVSLHLDPSIAVSNLTATGVTIINPPWQLDETLKTDLLPILAQALNANFKCT